MDPTILNRLKGYLAKDPQQIVMPIKITDLKALLAHIDDLEALIEDAGRGNIELSYYG